MNINDFRGIHLGIRVSLVLVQVSICFFRGIEFEPSERVREEPPDDRNQKTKKTKLHRECWNSFGFLVFWFFVFFVFCFFGFLVLWFFVFLFFWFFGFLVLCFFGFWGFFEI